MSDVSGIPYMGPMGQGNFFAPTFSYNPQINPTAGYAGPSAYGQDVLGGILQNTQRSQQHTADLITSAAMAMPNSPGGAFMFSDTHGPAGGWGGNAFNQSAINNFTTGGGGYNFPSIPNYSGGVGGSYGLGEGLGSSGFNTTAMQNLFSNWNAPQAQSSPFDAGNSGGGMFGGLAGSAGANQGPNNAMDWTRLFEGGGAAQTNPFPNMATPGGLGSPMSAPQPQQQPADFGSLFGQSVGGTGGAPPATYQPPAPAPQPGAADLGGGMFGGLAGGIGGAYQGPGASFGERFDALGGSEPMGDNPPAPAAPAAPDGTRTYDIAPMFEAGGGGGFGTGGADTSWTTGANAGSLGGDAFTYNPYQSGAGDGSSQSADKLAEQARARLADLISGAPDKAAEETAKAVEPDAVTGRTAESAREAGGPVTSDAAAGAIPLPRDRPAGADAPRPPGDVPPQDLGYLPGKGPGDLKGVNRQFAKAMQEFAREYNASQGDYSMSLRSGLRTGPKEGFHKSGEALDTNLIDRRTGERLNDYQTRDPVVFKAYQDNANQFHSFLEKNYPDLAAQHRWGGYFWNGGPGHYGSQDIMHNDLGGNRIGMAAGSWKEGLSQRAADAYGLPVGGGTATPWPKFNFDWSNAPIQDAQPVQPTYKSPDGTSLYQIAPDGTHIPVPIGRGMNETTEYDPFRGTSTFAAPVEQRPGVNQGQNVAPPPAEIPDPRVSGTGFNALDAAAKPPGPSGVEKAQTFLNRSLQSILQEHAPDKIGQAGIFLDLNQPLREALKGPFGGQILSGLEPKVGGLGLTRGDLAKAIADPRAKFGEGTFGPYPDYTGPEAAPGGTSNWLLPMPSTLHPDITDERVQAADTTPQNVIGPRSSAFNLDPGGYGEGGYGNAFNNFDEGFNPLDAAVDSTRDFQSPANDYSSFQQPASRADLAALVSDPNRVKMDFGGFSPSPEQRSGGVGPPVELTPEFMRTIAEVESSQNPNKIKGSYKGLYQLDNTEFRKYGGQGSIFDPEQNTKAASAKMTAEGQRVQDILGRELSPVEQYMVHQQGVGGALAHLRNPDQPAWQSMLGTAEGRQKGEAWAKEAIWGNLSDDMKAQFGSVNNITSRDFIALWTDQYAKKMVESGQPITFRGGFSASP